MDKLNNNQITALYLLNASHCKPLSALHKLYRERFEDFTREKGINAPVRYFEDTFCISCGQICIPGINVRYRIRKLGSGKRHNKRYQLRRTCLKCGNNRDDSVQRLSSTLASTDMNQNKVAQTKDTRPEQEPPLSGLDTRKSKERAKRRKENNLNSLLKRKKKDEEQKRKKNHTLDLMEFMK